MGVLVQQVLGPVQTPQGVAITGFGTALEWRSTVPQGGVGDKNRSQAFRRRPVQSRSERFDA
jgi:hypothetical protein